MTLRTFCDGCGIVKSSDNCCPIKIDGLHYEWTDRYGNDDFCPFCGRLIELFIKYNVKRELKKE